MVHGTLVYGWVGGTSFMLLSLTCIYCSMQTIKEVRVMEAVKVNLNYDETRSCKAKALASSVFVLYIVINVQMLLNCEWGPKCRLPESFRQSSVPI